MKKREIKTINMTVTDDDGFLSPYSEEGKPTISSEVADFLETAAKANRPKDKLRLAVRGDCIDEEEKKKYSAAIKNYYELKLKEEEREFYKKTVNSIVFTIIGILALAVMFLLSAKNVGEVWKECIDIFAWVFLWEAVDQFFIERGAIMLRRKRFKNFLEMEVSYSSL